MDTPRRTIERTVRVRARKDVDESREDLAYWLSRPPEERIAFVTYLRRMYYGNPGRLQRSVHRIQRTRR